MHSKSAMVTRLFVGELTNFEGTIYTRILMSLFLILSYDLFLVHPLIPRRLGPESLRQLLYMAFPLTHNLKIGHYSPKVAATENDRTRI